jgi:hypothetical protein
MMPNSKSSRLFRIAISILLLCIFVALGYWSRTGTSKNRNCRVCAATFSQKTVFAYGIPVWSWDTEILPGDETKLYFDRYLA